MGNKHYLFTTAIIFSFFFLTGTVLSQYEYPGTQSETGIYYDKNYKNLEPRTDMLTPRLNEERIITQQEMTLRNEFNSISHAGIGYRARFQELQQQLDRISGETVTPEPTLYPGSFSSGKDIQNEGDINLNRINNESDYMYASGIKMVQKGPFAGHLFAACGIHNTAADVIRYYRSTNGGLVWTFVATYTLAANDHLNTDELDMEIISETSSSRFFVYTVVGLTNSSTSAKHSLVISFSTYPTFHGNGVGLSWPVSSASKRYYCPRITTDNATYNFASNVWMHIICSFDSANASGRHINTQKYAYITYADTTIPVVTYLAPKYYWYQAPTADNNNRYLWSDIAYYTHSGADSVIVSFSGVPDSLSIFYSKSGENGASAVSAGSGIQGGEAIYKYGTRLATNETNNGHILTVFKQYGGSSNGIKYLRSVNYTYLGAYTQSVISGSGTVLVPDVVGRRGSNTFDFIYAYYTSGTDYVHYVNVNFAGSWVRDVVMNPTSMALTGVTVPKAGFRYNNNDSCIAIYCETGPYHLWAAAGCSGTMVGIKNENLPVAYELKQNYPNPFNPVTKISYAIPKSSFVKLTLFDVTGREIQVLVSEVKEVGTYDISWDATQFPSGVYFYKLEAGNYIETKKMILMK